MTRIQEKVKDLIEVCSYDSLVDFLAEPSKTLSSYHFTDITAELMANWLNSLVEVANGNGAAKALAGYRGVGKSHFLATLGAIAGNPELRSKVTNLHVSSSTQHLMRRRYPVAYVQRGLKETLLEEIRLGVAIAVGTEISQIPDNLDELLPVLSQSAGESPFVILVDTAFGRNARVARDDGVLLGEFAEKAKDYNIFIGVALDDDITSADGVNSAIAQSYTIDYLDQEHLYRIVNANIFPKNQQTQPLIAQIYHGFRNILPNFRWSEQRFNSLYPLHPAILELTPFIRLYAPDFALLGFASEAGARILGRPANSLIALDEVFDNVENTLRKAPDLEEPFEIYDKIIKEVISNIPIMQRLQAKLVLKALFVLSLDGDGTTASEISAAMMIYDEQDPEKAIKDVENVLNNFTTVYPEDVWRKEEEGKETRYSLKVSNKDNLNIALAEASKGVSEDAVPAILRRTANDKFEDWNLSVDSDGEKSEKIDSTDCQIIWRGGIRRSRLFWNWDQEFDEKSIKQDVTDFIDLEVFINNPLDSNFDLSKEVERPRAIWLPAKLTSEEIETIKRFHILLNDSSLREDYGEQVRVAGHTHIVAVEKIWDRIFLKDAKLIIDGVEHEFFGAREDISSLSELLSSLLEPLYEAYYPSHPVFDDVLGMNDVSSLVNDLFSGARVNHNEVQSLAETFALPLGLVVKKDNNYILETEDNILNLPLVEKIFSLLNQGKDQTITLKSIYRSLKEKPFGLVREAQHLILAALVAQRKIEFVTSKGDRISRRSLDLKIIWDDIDGIAKPESSDYGSERLTAWAKVLTGLEKVETIDIAEDRAKVKEALLSWLENWKDVDVLGRFKDLSDEILNTKVWIVSTHIEKTFGVVAEAIESSSEDSFDLEGVLQIVADTFSDSEEEFSGREKDLIMLKDFIEGANKREEIWSYLAICESTQDENIEKFRAELLKLIDKTFSSPNARANQLMSNVWGNFHKSYSNYFAVKHDMIMKSHQLQEKFDEILKSDEWWEFENLSKLPILQEHYWNEADEILSQFGELDCSFNVRKNLKTHPFCACTFNLAQMDDWEVLPRKLFETIKLGRESYARTLLMLSDVLVKLVDRFVKDEKDESFSEAAKSLIRKLNRKEHMLPISTNQLIILQNVLEKLPASPIVKTNFPKTNGMHNVEELRSKLNNWLNEMPDEPVLLKI